MHKKMFGEVRSEYFTQILFNGSLSHVIYKYFSRALKIKVSPRVFIFYTRIIYVTTFRRFFPSLIDPRTGGN